MSDVTRLLDDIARGDAHAGRELLPLVYDELRRLAAQKLSREPAGQSLQATALVHEVYLRLVGPADERRWESRRHFFFAAAEAMRRLLVDNTRRRRRLKRGGRMRRHDVDAVPVAAPEPSWDVLALDEALERFASRDPVKAELVKLRFFAGLTGAQAAEALGVSEATAERYWAYARAWLYREVQGGGGVL